MDLEALEMALRAAMHQAGAAALGKLLETEAPAPEQRAVACRCGAQALYREMRSKTLLTALGEVELRRPYYLCPHCGQGQFPTDVELDVENRQFSPGVRRMQALVGQQMPFAQGRQQLALLAGLDGTTKSVERSAEAIGEDIARCEQQQIQQALQLELPGTAGPPIPVLYVQMDATGVPVVKTETVGRQGKNPEQPPRTRDAKLGCVFTQIGCDEHGRPLREADSTTYTGAIESAPEFGKRLYHEVWRRGWSRAETKVVMGDGAEWIWNLSHEYFPGAIEIVDLYHAREHLWDLARALYPQDPVGQQRWVRRHQPTLDAGRIEKLTAKLRAIEAPSAELADKLEGEANYFDKNAERMRYRDFRRQKLFVGSGVIEAGCKTVIGSRLKQSGMFWTVRGANAILALRCSMLNGRFEDYWEQRTARAA